MFKVSDIPEFSDFKLTLIRESVSEIESRYDRVLPDDEASSTIDNSQFGHVWFLTDSTATFKYSIGVLKVAIKTVTR